MPFVWYLETAKARFMRRVQKGAPGECWIWTGGQNGEKKPYGRVRYGGHFVTASRAAYMMFVGPIPAGHVVRHSCDNTLCVNYEEHLLLGTQADNAADKVVRGRHKAVHFPGMLNPYSKLTDNQVIQILEAPHRLSSRKLKEQLGLSVSTSLLDFIRIGKIWTHIRPDIPRRRAKGRRGPAHTRGEQNASNGNTIADVLRQVLWSYDLGGQAKD